MSVDVHNHVMPTEALDLLRREPSYGVDLVGDEWVGVHHIPFTVVASFYDPAAKLAQLDEKGMDAAVISCPPPMYFYEVDTDDGVQLCEAANEGMEAFCRAQPDRLRWLANLPMQTPDSAVAAYRTAVEHGCVGAAVGASIAGRRLDEPEYEEFWSVVEELGRPVLVHPAFNEFYAALEPYYLQNVIGIPLETTVMVERMMCAGVLSRHPGVRLILLHGGGFVPYQVWRLAHASGVRPEISIDADEVRRAFGQLYFDTITHDVEALQYLAARVGIDHVMLGTDLPYDMATPTPMETLREAFDGAALQKVCCDNAAKVFDLQGLRASDPQSA